MKKSIKKLYLQQKKRSLKKIQGTDLKPRLSVFRSNSNIYAQLINDKEGKTLASCSTVDKVLKKVIINSANQLASFEVGKELANRAIHKGIKTVVFDRGNKPYHGRIKQLAQGARDSGLIF